MIKRLFIIFIVVCILISQLAVHADVVMGNDFLYKNESKTILIGEKYSGRRFYVNGPSGYVIPKEEPGSEKGVSTEHSYINMPEDIFIFKNGEVVCIEQAYLYNGEYWGVMSVSHAYQPPGWFRMDELLMMYEYEDFEKENQDKFYNYNGNYDTIFSAEKLVLWQWPGSDREKRVIDGEGFKVTNVTTRAYKDKEGNIIYDPVRAYKDNAGQEWIYVTIEYTYKYNDATKKSWVGSWVCLSDYGNSNIHASNPAPNPIKWSPDGNYKWIHTDVSVNVVDQYSLSNITKMASYEQNKTFTDVPENTWYQDAVAAAFEYGIISGKGNSIFDPNGRLSIGEALAIASRIHAFYKYGKEKGSRLINEKYSNESHFTWWEGVAQYCIDEGLISEGELEYGDSYYQYSANITRAQMVHAWSKILQPKDVAKQNAVVRLPDVAADTPYFEDIILFYEAGIIGGVDTNGTFNPDGRVTRAEAAKIFMNIIEVNKRHNGITYGNAH